MLGDGRRRTQTISAASWRFTRWQATSPDASFAPYKRGVRGFKSLCAQFFRIPVGGVLVGAPVRVPMTGIRPEGAWEPRWDHLDLEAFRLTA